MGATAARVKRKGERNGDRIDIRLDVWSRSPFSRGCARVHEYHSTFSWQICHVVRLADNGVRRTPPLPQIIVEKVGRTDDQRLVTNVRHELAHCRPEVDRVTDRRQRAPVEAVRHRRHVITTLYRTRRHSHTVSPLPLDIC